MGARAVLSFFQSKDGPPSSPMGGRSLASTPGRTASVSPYSGVDNSFSSVGSDRAVFTGSDISQAVLGDRSHSQMVNQYFNTSLFTVNAVGTYGNAPRNQPANPGLFNIDAAALKYFPINDRMKFQFRAQFFNLLNNVNFTVPGLGSANPNESAAGNIVGTGSFGKLTHAADPRVLQFALKFMF